MAEDTSPNLYIPPPQVPELDASYPVLIEEAAPIWGPRSVELDSGNLWAAISESLADGYKALNGMFNWELRKYEDRLKAERIRKKGKMANMTEGMINQLIIDDQLNMLSPLDAARLNLTGER